MTSPRNLLSWLYLLLLIVTSLLLCSCSWSTYVAKPQAPKPPNELMQNASEPSASFLKKVQDYFLKLTTELERLQPNSDLCKPGQEGCA